MRRNMKIQTCLIIFSSFLIKAKQVLGLRLPLGAARRESNKIVPAAAGAGFLIAAGAAYVKSREKGRPPFVPSPSSLAGETIVITGASTGLGLESAKRLAAGGANVILTTRSDSKGKAAVQQVFSYLALNGLEVSENQRIAYEVLDLDNLSSVRDAVDRWSEISKIDVLMNNAGIMAIPDYQVTVDGFERQIQSNHLGHFLLTALLAPKLSPRARIINVSSEAHKIAFRGLNLQYVWGGDSSEATYGPWKSYGQSKLANLLFTQELQRRSDAAGLEWTVVSLHPGGVATDLGRNFIGDETWEKLQAGGGTWWQSSFVSLVSFFVKTVEQGATTQVWLASRADEAENGIEDVRGRYFVDCKPRELQAYASDCTAALNLWIESEEKARVTFVLRKKQEVEV